MMHIQETNGRYRHIRRMLDTIDTIDTGSKLITLNMAVKTTQAQIAGHDISVANERNRKTSQ